MSSHKATESRECSGALRSPGWSRLALVAFLMLIATPFAARAQEGGSVSGVVVSTWDGANIPGVVVTVRGTTLAAQTDATGRYQLNGVPPGENVLRFSKSGFAAAVLTDVRIIVGQTTTVNGTLRPEFFEMEEYEITAEEFTEQSSQILFERQQSSALTDAIGSEQFSKLGAGDAAEALGKVSGASIADGKFAVIRGLADRYTSTTFNGVDIPSADPDRRAVQLDLFPSKFISRIDVSKTFSPDMPGGFAGGAINIVPRKIPEKFEFEFEAGMSYNTVSSLRDDFPMTDHGRRDWLAMDDGTRRLPSVARNTESSGQSDITSQEFKSAFGSSQMGQKPGSTPLNSSYFIALGDSRDVPVGRLGFIAGMTYKINYQFYEDSRITSYQQTAGAPAPTPRVDKQDLRGVIEYMWSANLGLGWELSEHHDIGFNFMYVQTAEDEARRLRGQYDSLTTPGESYLEQNILTWTERNLTYYQLRGGHQFEDLKDIKLDWATAMASTYQDEPDSRIFQFLAAPRDPFFNPSGTVDPTKPFRNWRTLEEDNKSGRIDLTIPMPSYNDKENFLKGGLFYSKSVRTLDQRAFSAITRGFAHPFHENGDPNQYLSPGNLQYITYQNYSQAFQSSGRQTIKASYFMGDWHVMNWLRFSGGLRNESTDLQVSTINLTKNNESSSSSIQRTDILPSASATIYFLENLLLRGAWSETIVRPTYREISSAEEIDAVRGRVFKGNPDLEFSTAMNYDIRAEWFPRPGSLVAASVFMKKIEGPIEQTSVQVNNDLVTFVNSPDADVRGVEFELREELGNLWKPLSEFSIGFNAAYIQSEVKLTDVQRDTRSAMWGDDEEFRPLYDQPEYVLNGDITWDHKDTGTRLTVSGGVVGRRLVLVGLGEPDDYEEPAPQLDIFLTQKIGKNWKLKFSAKNLLDPVYEVTQEWSTGSLPVESYSKGMTFGLSLGCTF
jgi:outer membrane receptor protein involved in Fe transport